MTEIRIETIPMSCVEGLDDGTCPDGTSVSVATVSKYTVDAQDVMLAVATLVLSVPANMFSTWLYEKLKQKKCQKLQINKRDVPLEEPEIRRALEEEIKHQEESTSEQNAGDSDS